MAPQPAQPRSRDWIAVRFLFALQAMHLSSLSGPCIIVSLCSRCLLGRLSRCDSCWTRCKAMIHHSSGTRSTFDAGVGDMAKCSEF